MLSRATRLAAPLRLPQRTFVSSVLFSTEHWASQPVNALKAELKARGLSVTGKKAILAARLAQSDASRAASSSSASSAPKPSEEAEQRTSAPADAPVSAQPESTISRARPADEAETPGVPLEAPKKADVERKKREYGALDVVIPQPKAEPEPEQVIPTLPDNYATPATSSAFASSSEEPTPKVMTVASAATHPGGGPTHTLHSTSDAHQTEVSSSSSFAPSAFSFRTPALGALASYLPALPSAKPPQKVEPLRRPLDEEERAGLFVLGGVLLAGYFLAKDRSGHGEKGTAEGKATAVGVAAADLPHFESGRNVVGGAVRKV